MQHPTSPHLKATPQRNVPQINPKLMDLHHHYQDSVESSSSPTCRQWDSDTTLPPPKLRMMCSFGGHIIPRPHDKSLCYMGGETRIVVADRHTSLADLCSRLSTTLLNGRQFSLKYQLPSEDLDSLVSVTTDEDLDNMVEEYDRLNASNPSSKPLRLRLFLFLNKPQTVASMGSLLDDAKSETWFVDALNGAGLLPRGLSDSAPIDNLLEPKDQEETEIQRPPVVVVETTTSFGSTSSSPSMSNLPPIKVKVDHMNQMAGLDEQFPHPPPVGGWAAVGVSDDERSDHGGGGMRKPPLPLQPVQRKFGHDHYSLASPDSKHGAAYTLHSPDSIASDSSSIASANCQQKNTFTQDPNAQSNRDALTPPATTQIYPSTSVMSTINYQTPISDSSDTSHNQDQQKQQFYQPRPHFIQHHTTNHQPQPVSSYYQVYAPPPQMDNQQYPLYFLPVTQNQPYNAIETSSATTPPLYPTKTVLNPISKPDSMYGTAAPSMIPVPNNQFQQYMNVSHHPPTPSNGGGKYGYEYVHPTQDPVYYSQHQSVAAPLPSQYQTMTPASAMQLTQPSSAQQRSPDQSN